MAHETPAPHTDRTPASVTTDPRPGDRITYTRREFSDGTWADVQTEATVALDEDGFLGVDLGRTHLRPVYPRFVLDSVLASAVPGGLRPRCLATDPRPGDTVVGPHGHREVTHVEGTGSDRVVWYLDADGAPGSRHHAAWEVGAGKWTSCHDRKGGARFDPRPGDAARIGDTGWRVTERVGGLLALVGVASDARATCPVEVWSAAGGDDALFPARYVRHPARAP